MSSDAVPPDALPRIRRFNRAVTAEIGALDASFLGRGRPMGEARMLHAIGRGEPSEGREVAEIRAELRLDSGLASRLLRSLEAEGLALGIATLRLDTNRALPEAASLYRRLGWSEIARFNDDPYAELFFEKRL